MLEIKEVKRNSPAGRKLMHQIYELRREVYTSLGWIFNPDNACLVKDEFDDIPHTTHFAMIENNEVIGTHRMTKHSSSFGLPSLGHGVCFSIFKIKHKLVSEASRLLIKQDRKYRGCAKQLLFNTTNYELKNNSQTIVSIGFSDHLDFFEFMGYRAVNKELEFVLDSHEDKKVVRKGTPIVATLSTLNFGLDLDKYNVKREFVLIKNGGKI